MDLKELESFKLSDAIKFHDTLNPALWSEKGNIDPEVRSQLILIAKDFMSALGISSTKVEDITVSGSNAAYSYTPHSDLDLHVVVDFTKLSDDEIYKELFNAKKTLYNDSHDIKIHNIPVELYVQDSNEPVVSLGEYSLLKNDWINIPKKRRANFNQNATKAKYEKIGELVELAIKSNNLAKVEKVIDIIKRYRRAGLDSKGEFGPENLAYKALRSRGYIDELYDTKDKLHSKELSIDESQLLDKPTMSPEQLAKKHRVSVDHINKQLSTGIKVEKEHTSSTSIAREIALDHLSENPNYYTKLKKAELEEGGWTTSDNPGIKAKLVKHGISAVNSFLKDFNPWLKKQGQGPVKVGHPTGSAAYHEIDDPENTIYGDMDLQVIVPDRPEYEEMTSGQIQGLWGRLMDAFIAEKNPSYIDKSESKISQPMFVLKDGTKMQVDIMPHPVKTSEWGRYRATGEHGLKGLLNGNIFATMSELLPINLQHKGLQYKAIDGKKVDYTKTRKGYKLHTVTTDIKSWIIDLFLHEAEEIGVKKPKIDKLLRNNPGVDVNNVNVERQVNGIKGFANSCEMNDMFGKGDLAAFSSADDFLYQFITHYVDKSEHAISAPKRDKASTPASQARAVKDREALSKGLEYVKKLFSGEVSGQRYKDYKNKLEVSEAVEWSKKQVIDYFVSRGKTAAQGAAAYERGWRGPKPKKKSIIKPKQQWLPYADDSDSEELQEGKHKVEREGIELDVAIDGQNVDIRASSNGRQLGYVIFYRDGDNLMAEDLAVDERYRGQGVAKVMYDYVRELGFTIKRSYDQTKAGKHFWDKNRGENEYVWEEKLHQDSDLKDVAVWMETTPDKLSIDLKQEPIEKFIKQIREMYSTYNEFPEDEERTNRILKLLNRGAKPMPIYVSASDNSLFVMEGRHRMVAFWLAGMNTIPVAYVSINQQDVTESYNNLTYQGNCTEDDVIEHIFGDVNNFARMVEEYGDEFEVDDLVVKYNPDEDIHYFYYKKKGIEENLLSSLIAQDQSERNEYKQFVQSKANGDYDRGAEMYADIKKRSKDDVFGDKSRLNKFMNMKFNFNKFTDKDWDEYWLLAQHCDSNIDFQKQALAIIKKYQGVDHDHYKYLYDRISCALTGKQKYGTQDICGTQQSVEESASGYIPSQSQRNDPRYSTALTVDVKPDTLKKNAKAFGFKVSRAGIPPLLRK